MSLSIYTHQRKNFCLVSKRHEKSPARGGAGGQGDVVEGQDRCHRKPRLIFSSRWPDAKKAEELRTVKRTAGALLLPYSSANIEYGDRIPYFWHEKSH